MPVVIKCGMHITRLPRAITGREKVGVAGRTGCGKSTLMMALKRIVEPSSGHVLVDGVDVAGVSLTNLRSQLALVPQVPHWKPHCLFTSGSACDPCACACDVRNGRSRHEAAAGSPHL